MLELIMALCANSSSWNCFLALILSEDSRLLLERMK